jgi:diguanylate cyclase
MQSGITTTADMQDATVAARLRTTVFAAADYAINILILFGFAAVGTISYEVPQRFLAVALAVNAAFVIVIAGGFTRRLRDPSMTALQVYAACGINLYILLLAPQITYMAMVNLFVLLSYGSLHFSQRMFLFTWFGLSCAIGFLLRVVGPQIDIIMSNDAERWMFWAVVSTALGRFLALNAEVSRLRGRLHERNRDLAMMAGKLADLASRDELTGLWNRREFMRRLTEERKRVERRSGGFCIALVDADHFKQVNDHFGHIVGDLVLQELAGILDRTRRTTDTLARYGGEEFILLLLDAKPDAAALAMERLRSGVELHDWESIAPGLRVTVSSGIAASREDEEITQLINRADTALYEAKKAGRNCLRIAQA